MISPGTSRNNQVEEIITVRNNTNLLTIKSKELGVFYNRGFYKERFLHMHTSFHILKIIFIVDNRIKGSIVLILYLFYRLAEYLIRSIHCAKSVHL